MYGGRRTLVFVLLSIGAGSLLWISTLYFRRKRRQRSAFTEDEAQPILAREEKPTESIRRIAGLRTRSQLKYKASLDSKARIPGPSRRLKQDEAVDRSTMIPDGKASDDIPEVLSGSPQHIHRCISQGVEEFKFAMDFWYQAAKHFLEHKDQHGVLNRLTNHDEMTLRALLNCSQKLRVTIVRQGLADGDSYAVLPRNILEWMQNGEEMIQDSIVDLQEVSQEESDSDNDSFLSASETAALEFDDLIEERFIDESSQLKMFRQTIMKAAGQYSHLDFYVRGLEHYARYDIECRKMRTEIVGCESDMEFMAKVVCLREASELAFSSPDNCVWMSDTGRYLLSSIIKSAGKDPTDFEAAFDELLEYCAKPEHWEQIEEELIGRRVPTISFYDVLLDYVLLDAFDDLATPPYSISTAIQNRWLSASIKETALTTAIWGVLKAKASYLQNQYGFMAHFYVISQYTIPVLAWGFMGTDEKLKELCEYFKDQVLGYIKDVFSFQSADYSTVTSLSESILHLARQRNNNMLQRLQKPLPQNSLNMPTVST